ncbi:hypothetical protein ACO2Q3_23575 [Caulobacter sp. KR2-114]|uniref:hypothetical protein n=1 Tax=Caulobacter sp. KR2-114 TaxID=3400912 RepID=UPI003C09BE3E
MKTILRTACAAAAAAAALVPASDGFAHTYRHYHHYRHYSGYRHYSSNRCHQRHMTNGTIIGAVGGGVVGGALSHGNALPAVALGSGLGALAGHAVGARSGC